MVYDFQPPGEVWVRFRDSWLRPRNSPMSCEVGSSPGPPRNDRARGMVYNWPNSPSSDCSLDPSTVVDPPRHEWLADLPSRKRHTARALASRSSASRPHGWVNVGRSGSLRDVLSISSNICPALYTGDFSSRGFTPEPSERRQLGRWRSLRSTQPQPVPSTTSRPRPDKASIASVLMFNAESSSLRLRFAAGFTGPAT
jgi:hypothetical protein